MECSEARDYERHSIQTALGIYGTKGVEAVSSEKGEGLCGREFSFPFNAANNVDTVLKSDGFCGV